MNTVVGRITGVIDGLMKAICVLFMVGMIVIILWQVATRWLPITVPVWTEEAARFLMVYMACFGGILAMNSVDGFIRVDIVPNALPARWSLLLDIVGRLLVLGLLIMLFEPALTLITVRARQVSPSLQLPMSIPQTAILIWIVGAALVGLKNILNLVRSYRAKNVLENAIEGEVI